MPFHHFPSNFVYWENIESHENIKSMIEPIILEINTKIKNNPFSSCKFNTSFFVVDPEMNRINDFLHDEKITDNIVWKPLSKMLDSYKDLNIGSIFAKESIINEVWWNVYDKNEFQELHSHQHESICVNGKRYHPSFSVIYVLKDDNEHSSVVFKQKYPNPFLPLTDDYNFDTSLIHEIKEGTVMIFSSVLEHLVKPCIIPGRITVAYNIFSEY